MIENALHLTDTGNEWKGTNGYWYREGVEIEIGDFDDSGIHADWFMDNFEQLGFTYEELNRIANQFDFDTFYDLADEDEYKNEGDLWKIILQKILDKGWIKVRMYPSGSSKSSLVIAYSDRSKDSLLEFASVYSNYSDEIELRKYEHYKLVSHVTFYSMGELLDELFSYD